MATSDKHLKPVPRDEVKACAHACADWLVREGFAKPPKSLDELILFLHPPGSKETRDQNGALLAPEAAEALAMPAPGKHVEKSRKGYAVRGVFTWLWLTVLPSIDRTRAVTKTRRAIKARPDAALLGNRSTLSDKSVEQEASAKWRRHVASARDFESDIGKLAKRQDQKADDQILLGAAAEFVDRGGESLLLAFQRCLDEMSSFQRTIDLLLGIPVAVENLSESSADRARHPTVLDQLAIPHSIEGWTDCRTEIEVWLRDQRFSYPEIASLLPGPGDARAVMQRVRRRRAGKKGK